MTSVSNIPILLSIQPYTMIGFTLLLLVVAAVVALIAAHVIGPAKIHRGETKDSPYESGMPVIGDTKNRFNVRFYIVAMLFLLFDVEVLFLWPWALSFYKQAKGGEPIVLDSGMLAGKDFLLAGMGMFFILLLFGLIYEWKRGAFEWD